MRHEGTSSGGNSSDAGGVGRLNLLLTQPRWSRSHWADALSEVLAPIGVTSIRAGSVPEAERAIRSVRVHIAVVDLGLPMREPTGPAPSADEPAGGRSGSAGETGRAGGVAGGISEEEAGGGRILDVLSRLREPPPTVVIKSPRTSMDERRELARALHVGAFAVVDRAAADLELMLQVLQRCLSRFYLGRWPGPGGGSGAKGLWM